MPSRARPLSFGEGVGGEALKTFLIFLEYTALCFYTGAFSLPSPLSLRRGDGGEAACPFTSNQNIPFLFYENI